DAVAHRYQHRHFRIGDPGQLGAQAFLAVAAQVTGDGQRHHCRQQYRQPRDPLSPAAIRLHEPLPLKLERSAGQPRSSSLMLVLARVFASTCLTITAQYSECEPSAAGSEPDTTTLPGGT